MQRSIPLLRSVPVRPVSIDWPRWRWLLYPLAVFLITRAIIIGAGYIAEIALPSEPGHWHPVPENIFLDNWARWDSKWYVTIVNNGYWFQLGQESNVAFFPVYPLLTSLVKPLAGDNTVYAGILVSHARLLLALMFLYRLTELELGSSEAAGRAIYYIAAFPTSFFFNAVYTESTFLLFSVATMYFARRQQWGWAGLMGMITSATRIVGVLMAVVVALEWARAHGWTVDRMHKRQTWLNLLDALRQEWLTLLPILLIPLGLLSYMAFLGLNFKDPVAFSTVQAAWYRQNIGPIAVLQRDLSMLAAEDFWRGQITWRIPLDVACLTLAVGLTPLIWRRFGASYALFPLMGMVIPAMSATGSLSRYIIVLFPVFMLLAHWGRHPGFDRFLTVLFSTLLGICTAIFVNWVFIA